jgi:hypothetical protein
LAIGGQPSSITGDALIRMLEEFVTDGDDGAKCVGVTFAKGGVSGSPARAE